MNTQVYYEMQVVCQNMEEENSDHSRKFITAAVVLCITPIYYNHMDHEMNHVDAYILCAFTTM